MIFVAPILVYFLCKVGTVVQAVCYAVKAEAVCVDDSRSLCRQLQAVYLIPVRIVYLILFVCDQEFASRMTSSRLPSTSMYGSDSACRNVRTGMSVFFIYESGINTGIIPVSEKKHFSQ